MALWGYSLNGATVLHMPNPLLLGHNRDIEKQWGYCYNGAHKLTPPLTPRVAFKGYLLQVGFHLVSHVFPTSKYLLRKYVMQVLCCTDLMYIQQ